MNYEIHPKKVWKRKVGFENLGVPSQVSIHGSLPSPIEAYEMVEKGFTIYDKRNNTYSNYFFGKIGIDTREEAESIVARLK